MASNKTVLTSAQKAARSSSFGSELPERPHSLTREVDDLRSDVEAAFARLESQTSIPVIYQNNIIPQNVNSKVSADATIHGANLLCGQTQASVTIANITFTAILPGTAANAFSVEIVLGGAGVALSSAFNANKLTITLADGGSSNNNVRDEVNSDRANKVTAVVNANGAVDCAVAAATSLSGGIGSGVNLLIHSSGTADDFSADINTFNDSQITLKASGVALTNQPATNAVCSVMVKNLNNSAMSHPSPTLPTIA